MKTYKKILKDFEERLLGYWDGRKDSEGITVGIVWELQEQMFWEETNRFAKEIGRHGISVTINSVGKDSVVEISTPEKVYTVNVYYFNTREEYEAYFEDDEYPLTLDGEDYL